MTTLILEVGAVWLLAILGGFPLYASMGLAAFAFVYTSGLPPLIVAADQEGGIVSHLSPPLSALPSLSTLADLPPNIRAKRAEEFGRVHGQELAAIGVNQDFAPVLDLRPEANRNRFDFNTSSINARYPATLSR